MKFSGINKLKNRGYIVALNTFSENITWAPCCTDAEYENAGAYPP